MTQSFKGSHRSSLTLSQSYECLSASERITKNTGKWKTSMNKVLDKMSAKWRQIGLFFVLDHAVLNFGERYRDGMLEGREKHIWFKNDVK